MIIVKAKINIFLSLLLLLLCFLFFLRWFNDIGILARIDPVLMTEENKDLIPIPLVIGSSKISFFADLRFYLEFIWRPSIKEGNCQFYTSMTDLSYEIRDLSFFWIDSSKGQAFDTLRLPLLSAEESLIFLENSLNERVFYPELARYLILEINYQNSTVKKILMNDTRLDQNLIYLILNDPGYVLSKSLTDHQYSTWFINEVSKNYYLSIKMSDYFFRTSLIQFHQKNGYLPDTKVIKTCFWVKVLQILVLKKEGIYKKLSKLSLVIITE